MQIDLYADTVCPWCLIGRARLRGAIASRTQALGEIRWRSYLLNPEMPPSGIAWSEYLALKFGSEDRGQRVHERIAKVGAEAGIDFRFERIALVPNTLDSHRLVQFAAARDRSQEMLDTLARGYFTDGADIGDTDTLGLLGREAGLDRGELDEMLGSDLHADEVWAQHRRARRIGLNGVPTIVFAGSYAIAGAQDEAAYLPLIDLGLVEADPGTDRVL